MLFYYLKEKENNTSYLEKIISLENIFVLSFVIELIIFKAFLFKITSFGQKYYSWKFRDTPVENWGQFHTSSV